ncbi:MAG: hypothetical protein R6U39_02630 [Candidatus Aegiribacteria sp.]
MILVLVLLGLLALEELLFRLDRGFFVAEEDRAGESVQHVEEGELSGMTQLLSWMRILQLLLFGVLFAVTAAYAGFRLIYTPAGQIAALLLLTQVVRILNRKVINQWAVLGATVIVQCLLLFLLLLIGVVPGVPEVSADLPGRWALSFTSFAVLFLLTVTVPFTGTYYLRLIAREGSGSYFLLPTLIYSEYWIRRLTRVTAGVAMGVLVLLAFLVVSYGYPTVPSLIHMATVMMLLSALLLFRNRSRLHHPMAVTLVLLTWTLRIGWLVLEASSAGDGWIG